MYMPQDLSVKNYHLGEYDMARLGPCGHKPGSRGCAKAERHKKCVDGTERNKVKCKEYIKKNSKPVRNKRSKDGRSKD